MSYVKSYQEILDGIDDINPILYARTRNQLSGAVTQLSPYISRGVISLPLVRDRLLARHSAEDCQKLIQELAWREYFQNVWWEKDEAIFSDIRFLRDDWQHAELVTAIIEARTGIEEVDKGIRKLYDTGYMHNHVRMWVASMACNLGGAHWHPMGKWLYYNLVDGDLASNFLSWQWVAGTSVNKKYTVNQALIQACSESSQTDSIIDFPREEMLSVETPEVLLEHEPFALFTEYPEVEAVSTVTGARVCLYTPWTLDPTWRREQSARRILVIDPAWFDKYPVSELVLDFIIRQGQTVMPELEVHIGSVVDIPELHYAQAVFALLHQTNRTWPVQFDTQPVLFPAVTGYYQSFYKYWQAVEKTISD
jgi:deoxyribodipyrimidine photo-lyase